MSFGPTKVTFNDILINSVGSLIAGIIGSILILIITFMIGNVIDITSAYGTSMGTKTSAIFPIVLSIITLIGTTLTVFLTYRLLTLTNPEKYKKNIIIFGQLAFFITITYIIITPVYLYAGLQDYDYIMYIYLAHVLITAFGTSIILEILNNYRYILTGIYGSFIGLFLSIVISILIFTQFESGNAKLIILVVLLPIINFLVTFFKQLFELSYYNYVKYTSQDQLGDIFYQIENEEKALLREEEEKNMI